VTAYDGESGLEKAKQERPDLMLLDVMMAHDSEGFEISRKIPEQPELKEMKVILVTGIRKEKELAYRFEPDETWLPVDRVLEKPVPPEKLLEEIKRELNA
jgi:CheY-like chemotaxis protein